MQASLFVILRLNLVMDFACELVSLTYFGLPGLMANDKKVLHPRPLELGPDRNTRILLQLLCAVSTHILEARHEVRTACGLVKLVG